MKSHHLSLLATLSALVCALSLASCAAPAPAPPWTRQAEAMGTAVSLTIYGNPDKETFNDFIALLKTQEDKLTIWDRPTPSEIMTLNQNAGRQSTKLSAETRFLLQKSLEYGDLTEGAIDVTIGPLVKEWGIATDHPKVPSQQAIDAGLTLVNYKEIEMTHEGAYLKKPGMIVDLGSIAKGYCADLAVQLLTAKGIKSAIIDIGGNIFALGSKPNGTPEGTPWKIGIQDPFAPRGHFVAIVAIRNESLTTAGIYERKFEENGQEYHHILDPKTGKPAMNDLASVTVISPSSTECDGLDTPLFVMGLDKGYALAEKLHLAAAFITRDRSIIITTALKDRFTMTGDRGFFLIK